MGRLGSCWGEERCSLFSDPLGGGYGFGCGAGGEGGLKLSGWVFLPGFEISASGMMVGNDAGLVGGGVSMGESEVLSS